MPDQPALNEPRKGNSVSIDRTTLEAKPRENSGKGPARRLRVQGLVPAVVYGRHLKAPSHIAVDPVSIKTAISTPHRFNTLITLKTTGQPDRQVLLRDYQQDPVTRDLLHADFLEVREDEKIKVKIPIHLVGKAAGVLEGGILSQLRREIEAFVLPAAIPDRIDVDVSHLKMAQSIHISDVKLPPGVEVKTTINYTVAVVAVPEKEEVVVVAPTPEAAAAEAAALAAAPAVEGKPGAPGAPPAAEGKAAAPAAVGKKEETKKEDRKKEDRKK
jgi:large subunit ribosomal protein L25